VDANEKAAIWLLENIFHTLEIPFVIAGKNPSNYLQEAAHRLQHTCIVANPDENEMQDMIAKAHVNILPSLSNSGIKLKLINALFKGKHCVVNTATVDGSGLDKLCHIADDTKSMQKKIEQLFEQPYSISEIAMRTKLLQETFNNEKNAKQQVQWIWG